MHKLKSTFKSLYRVDITQTIKKIRSMLEVVVATLHFLTKWKKRKKEAY